jgi:hypothetical protein
VVAYIHQCGLRYPIHVNEGMLYVTVLRPLFYAVFSDMTIVFLSSSNSLIRSSMPLLYSQGDLVCWLNSPCVFLLLLLCRHLSMLLLDYRDLETTRERWQL